MPISKIEKEIWDLYVHTIHCLRASDSKVWTSSNLTMPQIKILFILAHKGELSVGAIAQFLMVKTPNVTFILDHLKESGLITRSRSPIDRRMVMVTLTNKGQRLIDKLNSAKYDSFEKAIKNLNKEDKKALKHGLNALLNACQHKIGGQNGIE